MICHIYRKPHNFVKLQGVFMISPSQLAKLTDAGLLPSCSDSQEGPGCFAQRKVIDISGLKKPLVLKYLWDNAQGEGPGSADESVQRLASLLRLRKMTITEAEEHIQSCLSEGQPLKFDFLAGKLLRVDISRNQMNTVLYDDTHGQGAAETAISMARNSICEENFPNEFHRFDQAVAASNVTNMKELTEDQMTKLLAFTLYGEGDGKI